jgi:hypothetical protein
VLQVLKTAGFARENGVTPFPSRLQIDTIIGITRIVGVHGRIAGAGAQRCMARAARCPGPSRPRPAGRVVQDPRSVAAAAAMRVTHIEVHVVRLPAQPWAEGPTQPRAVESYIYFQPPLKIFCMNKH